MSYSKNQNLSKIAITNSGYSLTSTLVFKIGGLLFTVLIARLLLPELFGIYSLVLSIVMVLMTFTNLGTDETFLRYLSEAIGEKNFSKARGYFHYLLKLKSFLVLLVIFLLLVFSRVLSFTIYNKPLLYYPLIFSCLFILIESFKNFFGMIFLATKNLKPTPILEIFHQLTRIAFSVLIIYFLPSSLQVTGLFLVAAGVGFLHLSSFLFLLYKRESFLFKGRPDKVNYSRINKYLISVGLATISLTFFVSIDMLMLGKFVEASYLGYYRAAISLILTIVSFLSLSNIFLPLFTQIHGSRFQRGFQKTFRIINLFSIPALGGLLLLGRYALFVVYGNEYLLAYPVLVSLIPLIFIGPLISFYMIIFESKEKPSVVTKAVLFSLLLNIVLNYFFIKYLLDKGPGFVIIGVGIATVLSRFTLLISLMTKSQKDFSLRFFVKDIIKPLFATLIMVFFLYSFKEFTNINILFGILEIIFGIVIYFVFLALFGGINKEDFLTFRNALKR